MTTDPPQHGSSHVVHKALYRFAPEITVFFGRNDLPDGKMLPGIETSVPQAKRLVKMLLEVSLKSLSADVFDKRLDEIKPQVAIDVFSRLPEV